MTEEEKQPQSYLQIVFNNFGSTFFDMNIGQVTPLQIYSLIGHLKMMADMQLEAEMRMKLQQEAERKIAVPESADKIQVAR